MNMKKAFVLATAVAFLSVPAISMAAPPPPGSNGSNTNGNNNTNSSSNYGNSNSNSGSNSNSSATGKATATATSNGTNTDTHNITVGNIGINASTNGSYNHSRSVSISGVALSKNDLDQTITNNQHAPIKSHGNPNSINNHAFQGASGVMNVSQESGVNNSSMQTVNVNNSAGLR
ncbi:MAG: hypothetical protein ACYC9S_09465 [Leptospirales bacterium]